MNSDVQRIYRKLLRLFSSKIKFEESKKLLLKFYPVSDISEIRRRQEYLKKLIELAEKVDRIGTIEKPEFRLKRMTDRVLIVGKDEYEKAVKLGVCDVNVEGDYDIVLGSSIQVDEISAEEIVPEIFLSELYNKRESLKEVSRIMDLIGTKSVAAEIVKEVEKIKRYKEMLESIDYFEEFVYRKLDEIKKAVEARIESEKIVIEGKEILEILEKREIFSEKIYEIEEMIGEEIEKAESEIAERFGFATEIFVRQGMPRVNVEELERARREIERNIKLEFYLKAREILRKIKPLLPKLEEEYRIIYEIEMVKGLESLFIDYTFPQFEEGSISFTEGRNLFIEDPQPVSYIVGYGRLKGLKGFESREKIVILTGANSGGKTSLLHLIVQIQLLAQMGLPVPAKFALTEVVEEIYLFGRKKTVYGAGAFESTLKNFTSALAKKGKKLILVDEFEAITEPGAAIKMLSAFLRIAHERGFYMVVVSHMAENLKLDFVRIDGIEASGLDEKLELIVDRQPKFGVVGRSTPELIVERVYRLSRGDKRSILERVLETFKGRDI
ncbi:MAG: endonuclease MutS2 [Archaeoglobus sp.]|nr:endonuclease MutS2 [Archaeoglobus sp.]